MISGSPIELVVECCWNGFVMRVRRFWLVDGATGMAVGTGLEVGERYTGVIVDRRLSLPCKFFNLV